MIIVLGATGNVGSAVVESLLAMGERVTAVTRSESKAYEWRAAGAGASVVDITDVNALRKIFKQGRRAFLLNPPAPPTTDTDAEEHRTLAAIVEALDGSGLEKVVLESTYGAQPGDQLGDLSVLHDFEGALRAQPIPATFLRAAYYMTNWAAALDAAREGKLSTMLWPEAKLPMVAPNDLGRAAALMLLEPVDRRGIRFVEGPERYSPTDVANAFARALGHSVEVAPIPREHWEDAFRQQGFSAAAARSYARMTAASVDGGFDLPDAPERGTATLEDFIARLVTD